MIQRLRPRPSAPPQSWPPLAPETTWRTLPQRIAEGIVVGLTVGTLLGIGRLILLARRRT